MNRATLTLSSPRVTDDFARAFTLIELLVTIAIIGMLVAMVLMVVTNVSLKGQRIHCMSNVKQLALGSFMYASENSRQAGVEASAFPGGNWMGTLNEYAKVKGILICPSAPVHQPPPASGNEQGYADRAWVRWTSDRKTMFSGSYGYNGYLYSDAKFSEAGDPRQQQLFTSESAIQKPVLTPAFFDENWVDVWPEETDRPYANLYTGRVGKSHGALHHRPARQQERFPGSTQRRTRPKNARRDQLGFGRWTH